MAKCQDCDGPIVWLRKPGGGYLPPVEPLFDFAYNDHYIATVDGIAQPVPQVYKDHECLTWEERQLRRLEREREKQRLIEEDRARRAEALRLEEELAEARAAQEEEAERERRREKEREQRRRDAEEHERIQEAARATRRKHAREVERALNSATNRFLDRLLPYACTDCGADEGEPCRDLAYHADLDYGPHLWWRRGSGHNARYRAAPPDDRSRIHMAERWGPEYDGPWPPAKDDPGRYEMRSWLQENYLYVFEPEKVWLTDDEQETLTSWLAECGDIFREVSDGPEGLVEEGGIPGSSRTCGGHAGRDARTEEGDDDRVDPE